MAKFQRHIFICTNQRDGADERGCCKARGADAVAEAFKRKLYERGFKRIVRPNKSGCLDQCAHGVAVVVYPDGVWYGGVKPEDVDEIIESHIVGGKPVARLEIPADELTGLDPSAGRSC